MEFNFILATVLEISAVLLLVWGYFNEDKLIDFEDKCAWLVAAYIRKVRKQKALKRRMKATEDARLRTISRRELQNVVYSTTDNLVYNTTENAA